jgi:hypothetical protein
MTPSVSGSYLPLQKYLTDRYADRLVLTFAQIEDLIGFALPAVALVDLAWWATPVAGGPRSDQSLSWTQAHRTVTANLRAHTVLFEREAA